MKILAAAKKAPVHEKFAIGGLIIAILASIVGMANASGGVPFL